MTWTDDLVSRLEIRRGEGIGSKKEFPYRRRLFVLEAFLLTRAVPEHLLGLAELLPPPSYIAGQAASITRDAQSAAAAEWKRVVGVFGFLAQVTVYNFDC